MGLRKDSRLTIASAFKDDFDSEMDFDLTKDAFGMSVASRKGSTAKKGVSFHKVAKRGSKIDHFAVDDV